MKTGVITDCFKKPLREALDAAAALGLDGVQMYATSGECSPAVLDRAARAALRAEIAGRGLAVSALCADMGGHGFEIAADNPDRVARTKEIIDLCVDLGAPVATTHIGVIPADKNEERYEVMCRALTECGRYAREKGVTMAIETGPETARTLRTFLDDTEGGVGVNLDPANFVMVTGQDPVEAVEILAPYIVHTHAKDGRMLKKTDPKIIYDHFAEGGIEALNVADYFLETPLGEGQVDFPAYLAALRRAGYDGYLTIERETGADPAADIRRAVTFLRDLI